MVTYSETMDLNDWMIAREKTNAELASAIGVTRQALSRYRLGLRKPRPEIIAKIKNATNGEVTAGDFFEECQA